MKNRFGISPWTALAAAIIAALLLPAASSAAWSPIAPTPGYSGERPNDLTRIDTPGGGRLLIWHREVGGFDTVQGIRVAADGTPGSIFDISTPGSDFGQELQAASDGDGTVTVAWLADDLPNGVVRSASVPADAPPGPVVDVSPAGVPGETIEQMSIGVAPNGTVGYAWSRLDGPISNVEGVTVPKAGPVGTVRAYTDGPYDIKDPGIAPMRNNEFKLAWIADNNDTGFSNIATIGIRNDGSEFTVKIEGVDVPVQPTYLFPWTRPIRGLVPQESGPPKCEQLRDPPVTGELLFADTGATGNPRGLEVGPGSAAALAVDEFGFGQVNFAWIRDTVDTVDDPCSGDPVETISAQTAVETAGFDNVGAALPVTRVSRTDVDISDLEMQKPRARRSTLTWLADDGGTFSKQLYRFTDGAQWTFAEGPDPVDPRVTVTANGAMGIGWTDPGLLPGEFQVGAVIVGRLGNFIPVELPGLAALKSSSNPLVDPGTQGRHSVLFYGVDPGDIGSFYESTFSDPGISISPGSLAFGSIFLNLPSPPRSVYVTNSGSTATEVTSVAVTGADQALFTLANPSGCVGSLAPGASCRINVSFAPAAAGSSSATLEVETDAGDVSSSLSGSGIARTRVGLQVKPGQRAVRAGGRTSYRAVVTNRGGIAATGARLCFSGPRGAIAPAKRCAQIGNVAAGATRSVNIKLRVKGNARPRAYRLEFRLKTNNANPRRLFASLRVKPRR